MPLACKAFAKIVDLTADPKVIREAAAKKKPVADYIRDGGFESPLMALFDDARSPLGNGRSLTGAGFSAQQAQDIMAQGLVGKDIVVTALSDDGGDRQVVKYTVLDF